MTTRKKFPYFAACASLIVTLSCAPKHDAPAIDTTATPAAVQQSKQGEGLGVVKSIDSTHRSIVLDHNDIPGIMSAMAMAYTVKTNDILKGISQGDSVRFTLNSTSDGEFVVTAISRIPKR